MDDRVEDNGPLVEPERRRPGRPRKHPAKVPSGLKPGRPRKHPPKEPSGRKPGRPRKHPEKVPSGLKPGRPRKHPPKEPSGRKPGRPRKNPLKEPSGRKPGRPRGSGASRPRADASDDDDPADVNEDDGDDEDEPMSDWATAMQNVGVDPVDSEEEPEEPPGNDVDPDDEFIGNGHDEADFELDGSVEMQDAGVNPCVSDEAFEDSGESEPDGDDDGLFLAEFAEMTKACLKKGREPSRMERHAKTFPPKSAQEFRAMLPVETLDNTWTVDDEWRLSEEWGQHPLRRALHQKCAGPATEPESAEIALWRNTTRYMNCLPTDIISIKANMMYERIQDTGLGREVPVIDGTPLQARRALWSTSFCEALNNVLFHPAWRRHAALLSIVIQYTVICATGDVRPWNPVCAADDLFLAAFLDEVRNRRGDESFIAIRERVSGEVMDRLGVPEESWWSKLFGAIEHFTREERAAALNADQSPTDDKPYLVRTSDLHNVSSAIAVADAVYGERSFMRPDVWLVVMEKHVDKHAAPTPEHFVEALDAVWLDMLRWKRQQDNCADRVHVTVV